MSRTASSSPPHRLHNAAHGRHITQQPTHRRLNRLERSA